MKINYRILHENDEVSSGTIETPYSQLLPGIDEIRRVINAESDYWFSPWVSCEIRMIKED